VGEAAGGTLVGGVVAVGTGVGTAVGDDTLAVGAAVGTVVGAGTEVAVGWLATGVGVALLTAVGTGVAAGAEPHAASRRATIDRLAKILDGCLDDLFIFHLFAAVVTRRAPPGPLRMWLSCETACPRDGRWRHPTILGPIQCQFTPILFSSLYVRLMATLSRH
jgi:hypothetical protein